MDYRKDQKILFISHDASMTGAPIFLLNLIKWIKENTEISYRILLRNGGDLTDEFFKLGETYLLNSNQFDPKIIEGISLVYSNTITNSKFIEENGLSVFPIITHVHELDTVIKLFIKDELKELKKQTDYFIACSASVKENLINNHFVEEEKIHLVYEAIPTNELLSKIKSYSKSEVKKQIGIKENDFVIVGGGTATERKGIDIFLQVAADFKENYSKKINCKFIWVGKLPDDERRLWYEYDKKVLGVDDIVAFTDQVTNPEIFLFISDIFCLTSREDPFPLIMIEAALLGKPVIGFEKSGGVVEFCEKGTGFVVPYLDSSEMSKKIYELLNDKNQLKKFETTSPLIVQENFDISISAKKIIEVINSCKINEYKINSYKKSSKNKFQISEIIDLIQNHLKDNNYFEAYWLLEKVFKINPSNIEVSRLKNELFEKIKLKREEIGWNSKLSANNLIQAEQNIEKGELELAKNQIMNLLQLEPEHVEALNDLAVVNILEKNYHDAKNVIDIVLHLDPHNEIAIGNLDYMIENKFISSKKDLELFGDIEIIYEPNNSKIEQARQVWNNFDVDLARQVSWLNIEEINKRTNSFTPTGDIPSYIDKLLTESFPDRYRNLIGAAVVCGDMQAERGAFEQLEKAHFSDVYGFDISEKSLERVKSTSFNFHPVQTDCNDLILEPEKFDMVVGFHGIHHIYNVGGLLYQINKSLRPGGIFYIHEWIGPEKLQIPFMNALISRILLFTLFTRKERTTHENKIKGKFLTYGPEFFDPSEACNSLEITRQLKKYFEVKSEYAYGALCYPMFEGLGRNFKKKSFFNKIRFNIVLLLERVLTRLKIIKPLFLISISKKKIIWD